MDGDKARDEMRKQELDQERRDYIYKRERVESWINSNFEQWKQQSKSGAQESVIIDLTKEDQAEIIIDLTKDDRKAEKRNIKRSIEWRDKKSKLYLSNREEKELYGESSGLKLKHIKQENEL